MGAQVFDVTHCEMIASHEECEIIDADGSVYKFTPWSRPMTKVRLEGLVISHEGQAPDLLQNYTTMELLAEIKRRTSLGLNKEG